MKQGKPYWTEPEQTNSKTWITKKMIDGKSTGENIHKSKQDAWIFLKTINVYIDGNLVHSSI